MEEAKCEGFLLKINKGGGQNYFLKFSSSQVSKNWKSLSFLTCVKVYTV